eukprot:scaffold132348_cov33-Phaeocystis_antarctica.AAC.1
MSRSTRSTAWIHTVTVWAHTVTAGRHYRSKRVIKVAMALAMAAPRPAPPSSHASGPFLA